MRDVDFHINRQNTDSIKWDCMEMAGGRKEDLPFWIADLDCAVDPSITEAFRKRIAHPVFGYTFVREELPEAICRWYNRRYGAGICTEEIVSAAGVLSAMTAVIRNCTKPEDKVFLFTPAYPQFYRIIESAGCRLEQETLLQDEPVDWKRIEEKLTGCRAMILCNPSNPTARVWTWEELSLIAQLCEKQNVLLLSDEVHGDMVMFGNAYHSMAQLKDLCSRIVVFTSAAKTFNLAGLQGANLIIPEEGLRTKIRHVLEELFLSELNIFTIEGMISAYENAEPWLEAVKSYIQENVELLQKFLREHMPLLSCRHQGTFLAWVDARGLKEKRQTFISRMEEKGVLADDGSRYGQDGAGFFRMNLACSREMLLEGLERLKSLYTEIL